MKNLFLTLTVLVGLAVSAVESSAQSVVINGYPLFSGMFQHQGPVPDNFSNAVLNGSTTITGPLNISSPVTNTVPVVTPTNAAPFNVAGANAYLTTGARNTLDANIGHHMVHVWGQATNTLATPIYLWLTNETTHANSPLGGPSTQVAGTNTFSLWISGSGGQTVTLTNQFTPGAAVGIRVDGSEDIAW